MALEQELEFYRSQKQVLLQTHERQFAVIKDTKLLGTYTTFEEAFNAGVAAVGTEPFLIQQILEQEEVMQNPALSVGMILLLSGDSCDARGQATQLSVRVSA